MFARCLTSYRKLLICSLIVGGAFIWFGLSLPANASAGVGQTHRTTVVANDDIDDALLATTVAYSNTQNIIDATTAVDDPGFACLYDAKKYNTVWYRVTPSVSEKLVFSTEGSEVDTVIAVWTGTRGTLVSQACSASSQVQMDVSAGTSYYIEIARNSDYIIPWPTSMKLKFSMWSANTPPSAFGKSTPANNATNQPSLPMLRWGASDYASEYAFCRDTSDNDICDTAWISTTGTSTALDGLSLDTTYYWQVRAANSAEFIEADSGAWWSFTTVDPADLNNWSGTVSNTVRAVTFDVLTDGTQWLNYSVEVPYEGCGSSGTRKVLIGGPDPITAGSFQYTNSSNSLACNGTFDLPTTATGTYDLDNFALCIWISFPGYCCWTATSGSGLWAATGPRLTPEATLYLPLLQQNGSPMT